MYSLEDRMKAVQLYIDTGCNGAEVIRSLGYPSPNALRQWYKEYTQTGKLHKNVKKKCRYTQEQIEAAVRYYDEHGGSLAGTLQEPSVIRIVIH